MLFWFEVALAASGASDQGLSGAFARFHGCSNDNIGGRGRLRRPEIVLQQEQTSVINTVYRRCQFFPGVVDTGQK